MSMAMQPHWNSFFDDKIALLKDCAREMTRPECAVSPLMPRFKELARAYEDLLRFTIKMHTVRDVQDNYFKAREEKYKRLLDNSNQGFFTFGPDLLIHPEYSVACERIFRQAVSGMSAATLLARNEIEAERFRRAYRLALLTHSEEPLKDLPTHVLIHGQHLHLEHRLITLADNETAVLAILTDVTERMEYEAKVRYLSEHDGLSGLYNRTYVEKMTPRLLEPSSLPLSLIFVDGNALKLTNDVFGHEKGDQLIVALADVIKSVCRSTDIAARWGGDEFLLLLPKTDEEGCRIVAERIRAACRSMTLEFVEVSASIGTATTLDGSVSLNELFAIAEHRMYKNKLVDHRQVRKAIVDKIITVLESRGIVSQGHVARVRREAAAFARFLGMKERSADMNTLLLLASLHDVGKVALPQDLLRKETPFTEDDWIIGRHHTETGYRMAQSIGEPLVAEAILCLRERWDGSGYPNGLKGDEIPYLSRLFALVEVYDVMIHPSAYKAAKSPDEALEEIRCERGKQFDPELTDFFLAYMAQREDGGKHP